MFRKLDRSGSCTHITGFSSMDLHHVNNFANLHLVDAEDLHNLGTFFTGRDLHVVVVMSSCACLNL